MSVGIERTADIDPIGRVAYLAVSGELIPVLVASAEGRRLRTVDAGGVVRIVAPARLFWVSDARVPGAAALAPWWAAVQARATECDAAMAWDMLAEAGTLAEMDVAELAGLTPGGSEAVDRDAVVVTVFGDSTHFKLKKGRLHPTKPEVLEAARKKAEEEARAARALELAVAALAPALRLTAGPAPTGSEVDAALGEYTEALIDLAVHNKEAPLLDKALALLAGLGYSTTRGSVARRAFDTLVKLGEFDPDENLFVRRAGVRRRFPTRVLEDAAEHAARGIPESRRRKDRRDLLTVAIDDERTTEVDDAFAIEGDRLHVFIADAAGFAPIGSEVDVEARRRASTLYLPEGKVPMMPDVLAEHAASLEAGVDRTALGFSAELSADGELIGFEVEEALIRVARRMTYVECDAILAGRDDVADAGVRALVREAQGWMQRHREARRRRGALLLQRREVAIAIGEDRQVSVTPVNANGPGRQLVSEMMVAIGVATATWCADHGVPCAFRGQPPPTQPTGVEGQEVLDPAAQVAVLRQLKPSVLDVKPMFHFTLGVGAYTQVTSPIRRYQDLLMHQQLRAFLRTGRPKLRDADLRQVFDHLDKKAASMRRVEQASRRFWLLRYLEQNPGREWGAVALRQMGRRWVVELDALAMQTMVRPKRDLEPGERLRFEVADVSARNDILVLREVR